MLDEAASSCYRHRTMRRADLEGKTVTVSSNLKKSNSFFVITKKSILNADGDYFDTKNIMSDKLQYEKDEFLIVEQTLETLISVGMLEFKVLTQYGVGFFYINEQFERINVCSVS